MEKRTKAKSGRVNSGFDPSPEPKKSQETIYIPVRALNVLPDDEEYPLRAVLLPPTPDTKVNIIPQFQPIQVQPLPIQQSQVYTKSANNENVPSNNTGNLPTTTKKSTDQNDDQSLSQQEDEGFKYYSREHGKALLIFLHTLAILLIAFDAIQDWCQLQEILTVDERKNDTLWSLESFNDYFTFPNSTNIEEALNNVTYIKTYFNSNRGDVFLNTHFLTAIFVSTTVFGSAFSVIRFFNIIGEMIKDCKLNCFSGFQIFHGWTESLISLLLEDSIQCSVLYLYLFTCQRDQLGYVKLVTTLVSSFIKNIFRFYSCRQRRYPGLNIDMGPYKYCHICCGPQEPCSVQRQYCSYGFECPCFCSCGRFVVREVYYEEGEQKSNCCKYSCFLCFKDKDFDPICTKRLLQFFLVSHVYTIVITILAINRNKSVFMFWNFDPESCDY